jgi:hypothetical protein
VILVPGKSVADKRYNTIKHIMDTLSSGEVVVEGKHDVRTLSRLGISSVTLGSFGKIQGDSKPVRLFIMMDLDKGGSIKESEAVSLAMERYPNCTIDTETGKRFLKMLNLTSIEQAYCPVREIIESGV